MAKLFYDLHIHSCLSPCGDNDMTPNNIINMALIKELDMIAVTDHNACDNVPALMKLAQGTSLRVIPGVELSTAEEVHVVCLFSEYSDCKAFCDTVKEKMPQIQNKPEIFGDQLIMNEKDEIVGTREELLINACGISVMEINEYMDKYRGVCIAAHIEKPTTSVLSNLGFFPAETTFDGKEIFAKENLTTLKEQGHIKEEDLLFFNSDAHILENISEPIHQIEESVLNGLLNQWR